MSAEAEELSPLKVIAVVASNGGESLVLNRPVSLRYRKEGNDYIGADGPFRTFLRYDHSSYGGKTAFAGRELTLTMEGGAIQKIKDWWWDMGGEGCRSVGAAGIDELKACYVFCGYKISPEGFTKLRATYTGCVYPYWDYEKLIKWDTERGRMWDKISHLEGRVRALVEEVKIKHRMAEALQAQVDGFRPAKEATP